MIERKFFILLLFWIKEESFFSFSFYPVSCYDAQDFTALFDFWFNFYYRVV